MAERAARPPSFATRGGGSALSGSRRERRRPIGTGLKRAKAGQTLALSGSPLTGSGDRGPDPEREPAKELSALSNEPKGVTFAEAAPAAFTDPCGFGGLR